jgi:hypothetical protein
MKLKAIALTAIDAGSIAALSPAQARHHAHRPALVRGDAPANVTCDNNGRCINPASCYCASSSDCPSCGWPPTCGLPPCPIACSTATGAAWCVHTRVAGPPTSPLAIATCFKPISTTWKRPAPPSSSWADFVQCDAGQAACGKALDVCQCRRGVVDPRCHLPGRATIAAIAGPHGLFEGGQCLLL